MLRHLWERQRQRDQSDALVQNGTKASADILGALSVLGSDAVGSGRRRRRSMFCIEQQVKGLSNIADRG
jgi:hypothetical protein